MQVPSCRHGEDMHSTQIHLHVTHSVPTIIHYVLYTVHMPKHTYINTDVMLNLQEIKKIQNLFP